MIISICLIGFGIWDGVLTKMPECIICLRGSFQKLCTLYVFCLKMDLFYKINLQPLNVISIVLYHSGQTFGQFLYSCLDAFVFDASDYSDDLIRHLVNASEAFPHCGFFGTSQSLVGSAHQTFAQPIRL
jgi:hypothetical protein